jgi:hypothetical protein
MTPYEWYHEEATRYCEEHDLGTFGVCLGGSRGVALQNLGRWDEAVALCRAALAGIASPFNRMYLLIPLATIQARRAAPDAAALLDEIWRLAQGAAIPAWSTLVASARLEAAWLSGTVDDVAAEIMGVYRTARDIVDVWYLGPLLVWMRRAGLPGDDPGNLPEPFASEVRGDHRRAAALWRELQCPYEEALDPARGASHDEGRSLPVDEARTGGPGTGRGRPAERRDREAPVHLGAHGRASRVRGPGQDRSRVSTGSGAAGGPARDHRRNLGTRSRRTGCRHP